MVVAAIFAGGVGSRMGNFDTPKQYLQLGTKPILVHTVEKFYVHPEIDQVVVLCPQSWIGQTRDMLTKALGKDHTVDVVSGGGTRNETLEKALAYVEAQTADAILLTHDAVRPFVTHRIISENIAAAREHGACDTVIPATDTIVQSYGGGYITTIPDRETMFQGQTPQSFQAEKLRRVLDSLSDKERESLTDACKVFTIKHELVAMVPGEVFNIKITYPYDLEVANALLEREMADD